MDEFVDAWMRKVDRSNENLWVDIAVQIFGPRVTDPRDPHMFWSQGIEKVDPISIRAAEERAGIGVADE